MVSKLDGSFKLPTAAANVEVTDLQQRIFNAPVPGSAAATSGLPLKPPSTADQAKTDAATPDGRGQKRGRDEEEEEDSDVAMEEDSDDE